MPRYLVLLFCDEKGRDDILDVIHPLLVQENVKLIEIPLKELLP